MDWLDSIDPMRFGLVRCIEANLYELEQSHGIRYYSLCEYNGEHVDQLSRLFWRIQ